MPVELRTQRDGALRDSWYGRYEVNGKRHYVNLGVKVSGTPPTSRSLRDEGDTTFERSRAAAIAKLDSLVEESRTTRNSERLVQKLYEIKTGETIKSVKLPRLADEWVKIPRKRKPKDRYSSQCQSTLARFAEFVQQHNHKASEIAHVTRTVARSFMDAEEKRGVTAKTWNDVLKLLRATFKYLLPAGAINPFSDTPTRETETVFRIPFTPDELKAIMDAARDDGFIRPILVTGICTAMRRGDCCLLEWKDVDLEKRFITVKTSKTGQTVSIPIFPMLYDELKGLVLPVHGKGKNREGYVFPEQARMYLENADGITWRVKKVLVTALGEALVVAGRSMAARLNADTGLLWVKREGGKRRASVRDFHSFRVTWVTLALTAGVPLELVQKVTGHKTTDIVLKHYFQPGREAFRQALHAAMPKLLTNGQKSPKDEMRQIIEGMKANTLKRDKARLLELLRAA